ncbi:capsule assembly Wzi family protein [bacterium]|nr:capsule assembly Wzi family protein [bacterium]
MGGARRRPAIDATIGRPARGAAFSFVRTAALRLHSRPPSPEASLRHPIARFALLAFLAVAECVTARAQGALRVGPGEAAYAELEHFRALGLWDGSLELRPLRRDEIARALAAVAARRAELAPADARRLARLEALCAEWLPATPPAPRAPGREPRALWELAAGLSFLGGPTDLDSVALVERRPRRKGFFHLGLDAEAEGRLTAQLRFYEDYSRLSRRAADSGWVDNLPGSVSELIEEPSARLDRAVLAWGGDWAELRLGREDRRWGAGRRGSLFLSENPFPLDGISFHLRTRYLTAASLFAQTQRGPNPPSYIPGAPFPPDSTAPDVPGEAYVALHRLELRPPGPFSLGLYEAVAYGGRGIDLAYLNPVTFLVAGTQDIFDQSGTDDKKALGLDGRLDLPPLTIYGEFLLDRIVALKVAEPKGDEAGISSFAQLIGLLWANPLGLAGADLEFEAAHLDPQVYFHHDRDIRRAFLRDDRLGEGRLLGHWLGPNADGLYAALRLPPANWGRLGLEFEQCRWGLVEGEDGLWRRGADFGFIGLQKQDKAWLVGERSIERLYRVTWERASWRAPGAGRLDLRCGFTRVERSGLWPPDAGGRVPGDGWQLELGLAWRLERRLRSGD